MDGGRWVSTVRVSAEVVRSNAVPVLEGWAAKMVSDIGEEGVSGATIAMRQMDHIVATCEGASVPSAVLEDFVEVVEYDPVRHVALVIGLKDAPRSIPLVWLLLRVFPGADGVAVLPNHRALEPVEVRPAPRGSFEEAFAVAELMTGSGRRAVLGPAVRTFSGLGTMVVVPPRGDPVTALGLVDGGE